MPIFEVENATNFIVNKRSIKGGYVGIENELFFKPKTSMLFCDAKKSTRSTCIWDKKFRIVTRHYPKVGVKIMLLPRLT